MAEQGLRERFVLHSQQGCRDAYTNQYKGQRERRGERGERVQKRRRKKGEESLPRTDLSAIAASSLPAGLNSMFPSVRIPTKILYNSEFNAEKR